MFGDSPRSSHGYQAAYAYYPLGDTTTSTNYSPGGTAAGALVLSGYSSVTAEFNLAVKTDVPLVIDHAELLRLAPVSTAANTPSLFPLSYTNQFVQQSVLIWPWFHNVPQFTTVYDPNCPTNYQLNKRYSNVDYHHEWLGGTDYVNYT